MVISTCLATARRTTLTLSLCAALAAGGAIRPADALSGSTDARASAPPAHGAVFPSLAAMLAFAPSSDAHSIAVTGNTIPVTSCDDDGSDGTLRKAIEVAADGDTIDMTSLACSLITLQSGALVTAVANLSLSGPGVDALTIDGNASDRVLTGTSLSISDLSVKDGVTLSNQGGGCISTTGDLTLTRARVAGCSVVVSSGSAPGGGALVLGNLTMNDAEISGSTASGQQNAGGGGAFVIGTSTLDESTIDGNLAEGGLANAYGGGLMGFGEVTLHHSAISSNRAETSSGRAYGGGLQVRGDITVAISDSSVDGNSAYSLGDATYGGGINDGIASVLYHSTVTITRSTVSGNTAVSTCSSCVVSGGGVHAFDSIATRDAAFIYNSVLCDSTTSCVAGGGAVSSLGANVSGSVFEMVNTTISSNEVIGGATGIGGGIAMGSGRYLAAKNSTIAFNHASHDAGGISSTSPANAPSMLVSTIVSNNQTNAGQNDIGTPNGTTAAFGGGSDNIVMAWTASVTMPLNTRTLDPDLLPLSIVEGGSTAVHPLSANSFAVDAGINPDSLGCDQRGYPYRRVHGSAPDVGAYEAQEQRLFAANFDGDAECPASGP